MSISLSGENYSSLHAALALEQSSAAQAALVKPVVEELGITDPLIIGYSRPIDPNMAYANDRGIFACPLFTVNLELIPKEIRPESWEDPRLCDLAFLQKLSDWLARAFNLGPEPVSVMHIAACKTILRLRENPQKFQLAFSAGVAHELGHVILKHNEKIRAACYPLSIGNLTWMNPRKWYYHWKLLSTIRQCEREADRFASTGLRRGVDGIVIGFRTWQDSLIALRESSALPWRDRLFLKLMVSPWGNPLPLYFTHGSFDQRIRWASQDVPDRSIVLHAASSSHRS